MFCAPQWHGATQTHFPPRPRKYAWHCDIANVLSPHGPPHTRSKHIVRDTTNHPAHQRHAAFTPACVALPSGTAPRKRTSHQGRANHKRNFATRSAHTLEASISHDTTNHPPRQRHAAFTPACFALPRGTAQGSANPCNTATSRT